MIETPQTIERRIENTATYPKHRITKAGSKSIKPKIHWVKHTTRGFRKQQNFITAIYFRCSGLDLKPYPLYLALYHHFALRPHHLAQTPHGARYVGRCGTCKSENKALAGRLA